MQGPMLVLTVFLLAVIVVVATAHLVRWVWFPGEEEREAAERRERDREARRRGLAIRSLRGDGEI